MPTVKTREFKHTSLSGEVMQFKAPITVDAHGEFTVNIPEDLAPSAQALLKAEHWKGRVRVDHARVNWRVQGRVLGEVERFVEEAMKEHLAVEVSQELVILYAHENMTTYARAADGSMHPNGHLAGKGYKWSGNPALSATTAPAKFSVGVVARVYVKTTYARPSGSRLIYERPEGTQWESEAIERLNGFVVEPLVTDRYGMHSQSNRERLKPGVQEMPYADAAAHFFADMMLAMCRLGEQLDTFVGNRETLMLAIERGATLLPAPRKQED